MAGQASDDIARYGFSRRYAPRYVAAAASVADAGSTCPIASIASAVSTVVGVPSPKLPCAEWSGGQHERTSERTINYPSGGKETLTREQMVERMREQDRVKPATVKESPSNDELTLELVREKQ